MPDQSLRAPIEGTESLDQVLREEAAVRRVTTLLAEQAPQSAVLEAVAELRRLAESHGALRRVALLVAQGAEPERLFEAIAEEASRILGVDAISLISYDTDAQMFTQIAATHGPRAVMPNGGQWPLADSPLGRMIIKSGHPGRIDDWSKLPGPIAARHRENGLGQAVSAPILVNGALWGQIAAFGNAGEVLPPGCETRLADFTQLMATAISNVQAHDELRSLAESQGALRRVATLVAQGAEPKAVFAAVAVETSRILGVGAVSVISYDPDTEMFTKIFGTHGQRAAVPDGGRWGLADCPEGALVLRTGGPCGSTTGRKSPARSPPGTGNKASASVSPHRSSWTVRYGATWRPSGRLTRFSRRGVRRGLPTSPA